MKHLSLQNLEMVAAGRNFTYAPVSVAGYSFAIPYPTAKATKKFLEKTEAISAIAGYNVRRAIGFVSANADNVMANMSYAGGALAAHMVAEDNVDAFYDYFGLESGSDKK